MSRPSTNTATAFKTEITRDRPLAPAPLPLLAGVVVFAAILMFQAAKFDNDWAAVFSALLVLGLASLILDRAGRRAALANPHPLWHDQRLPREKSALKNFVIFLTLLVLIAVAVFTAQPDSFGSPYPYFVATEFLYLVVPQLFARRMRRAYDAKNALKR